MAKIGSSTHLTWKILLAIVLSFIVLSVLLPCSVSAAKDTDADDSTQRTVSSTEDEEVYDEDEFVGFEPKKKEPDQEPPSEEEIQKQKELEEKANEKLVEEQIQTPPPPRSYWLEGTFICVIVGYLLNFWIGKSKNQSIADAWIRTTGKFFASNFSKVGTVATVGRDDEEYDLSKMLTKEYYHIFKLRATGRVNCIGLQATLNLKKRHDMFSMILDFFSKGQDTVTIDILMDPETESMDKFVFAVVKKKEEKKYRKSHEDVNLFARDAASISGLPASLSIYSEVEELIPAFLHHEVLQTLENYEDLFIRMHFSDQGIVSSGYKYTLSFEFKLPAASDMNRLTTLTKMTLHYIDAVARTKLSKPAKQKSDASRAKFAEQMLKQTRQQREEAIQQKKLEKRQKEKEKMEKMSPLEREKYEEKLRQRDLKKRQPKVKVTMG